MLMGSADALPVAPTAKIVFEEDLTSEQKTNLIGVHYLYDCLSVSYSSLLCLLQYIAQFPDLHVCASDLCVATNSSWFTKPWQYLLHEFHAPSTAQRQGAQGSLEEVLDLLQQICSERSLSPVLVCLGVKKLRCVCANSSFAFGVIYLLVRD